MSQRRVCPNQEKKQKCRNSNPDLVQPCDCESCTKENDRIEAFVYKPLEKHDPYRSVDKFDPKNNVWERVAPMLHYRRLTFYINYSYLFDDHYTLKSKKLKFKKRNIIYS